MMEKKKERVNNGGAFGALMRDLVKILTVYIIKVT